jgi:multidrug efflux pump subunit AcrB
MPIKTASSASVFVGDVGKAQDAGQLQTNIVRVDGQHSVYIPVLKQGGGSNTISIVNGVREAVAHLLDVPKALKTNVVFDQSVFVKIAVKNVINEGTIGLCLTALIILLFLGNVRATISVLPFDTTDASAFLLTNSMPARGRAGNATSSCFSCGVSFVLSIWLKNSTVSSSVSRRSSCI